MRNNVLSIDQQSDLLHECVAKNLRLADELANLGLTYDDLRYRSNQPSLTSSFKSTLAQLTFRPSVGIPAVSFFSGAGGLDLGFSTAGFDVLAAFEKDVNACQTLRTNFPQVSVFGPPFHEGDLRNHENIITTLNTLGLTAPFDGVFFGGPPCQPFSVASNQRFSKDGPNFKRIGFHHDEYGSLLDDYAVYIRAFKPTAFVIENVPGISDGSEFTCVLNDLAIQGYDIARQVLNSSHYGVPQDRKRLFVVGWRRSFKTFTFPADRLGIVPVSSVLRFSPGDSMSNHVTREHEASSILRYMELHYGDRDKLGRVDRLNPGLPSKTIISGGSKGGGRSHLHPNIPRTLSPRECARIQTFPDEFVFRGSAARQFTQIGNAVPPALAQIIADRLLDLIFETRDLNVLYE